MNAKEVIWFIEEEENAIIVYYRDGHREEIKAQGDTNLECQANLKEKKESIKRIMEAQAYNYAFSYKNEELINNKKNIVEQESNKKVERNQFIMILLSGAIALGLNSQIIVSVFTGMSFGSVAYTTIKRKILLKKLDQEMEDIEKYKYFLNYKEKFEEFEIETLDGKNKGKFSIFQLDKISFNQLKNMAMVYDAVISNDKDSKQDKFGKKRK